MTATPRKSPTRTPRKAVAPRKAATSAAVTEPRLVEVVAEETAPLGPFAQMAADATANYTPHEPYVIGESDGIFPDIVITEPVETERIVAMAMLFETDETKLNPQDFQPLLAAVCGDAYERVWSELLRGKHFAVTVGFLGILKQHFYGERKPAAAGASALPGKSGA